MQELSAEVSFVMVAGMLIFFFLIIGVVLILFKFQKRKFLHAQEIADMQNEFQREILQTRMETQEETFQQIAKEIHDNVGQLLSSTKMLVGVAQQDQANAKKVLDKADETLAESILALRSLSKSLDKEWLDQFNLLENLATETERINTSGELTISFIPPAFLPIPSETQIVLFRIIQEALQNAIKHSGANMIHIGIESGPEKLYIEVIDDGKGFNTKHLVRSGMGSTNILNRARMLGGNAEWESDPRRGTKLIITIPIKSDTI